MTLHFHVDSKTVPIDLTVSDFRRSIGTITQQRSNTDINLSQKSMCLVNARLYQSQQKVLGKVYQLFLGRTIQPGT